MVALGGVDAYCEFGIHAWDIAAGDLLVREAGGVVIDPAGMLFCSITTILCKSCICSISVLHYNACLSKLFGVHWILPTYIINKLLR